MFSGLDKYVINLASDEDRLIAFHSLMRPYGRAERHLGVDVGGEPIGPEEMKLCGKDRLERYPGSCGCLLAHARLWRRSRDTNRVLVVFEDDAAPTKAYQLGSDFLDSCLGDLSFDLVFLSTEMRDPEMEASHTIVEDGRCRLVRYTSREGLRQGGRAYVMAPTGAAFLLNALERQFRMHDRGLPDVFMIRHAPDMAAYNVVPNLMRHADCGVSRRDEADDLVRF